MTDTEEKSTDANGVPDSLRKAFWRTVLHLNVGPISVSLGLMLWYFRSLGEAAPFLVVGVFSLARAGVLYRRNVPDVDDGV
ncbi:hypothetical protein ACEU6E_05800 [Halorutilales archaeon Cl-col2-1]|nr:hypothetical protein [Halobacteria archaeon]